MSGPDASNGNRRASILLADPPWRFSSEALQDHIDKVWPGEVKLEIFARETRPGWRAWGNETTKFDEAAA